MNTPSKPIWMKKRITVNADMGMTNDILDSLNLNTVCREANCPNYLECFSKKTATFMILGVNCTRNCRFCNVTHSDPQAVDEDEPERIGLATAKLGLSYIVVTSVTRDDLHDGGAGHFAEVIKSIRKHSPGTAVEVLIPDFGGSAESLSKVTEANPDVISHNIETVKYLYEDVRPEAEYDRSLALLKAIKELDPKIRSKSGLMVGLGETKEQIYELMDDLIGVNCEFLTIGQYLAPTKSHHAVIEYVSPEIFENYREVAVLKGFKFVASSPFVRSSYNASEALGA